MRFALVPPEKKNLFKEQLLYVKRVILNEWIDHNKIIDLKRKSFFTKFVFEPIAFHYSGMYCGNDDVLYESCKYCPRANDTVTNNWCDGNCYFDPDNKVCEECKLRLSSVIIAYEMYGFFVGIDVNVFSSYFPTAEYENFVGYWYGDYSSSKNHPSLMKGKRYCSKEGNCFGVGIYFDSWRTFSMTFPIRLTQQEEGKNGWKIHKKEKLLGIVCLAF